MTPRKTNYFREALFAGPNLFFVASGFVASLAAFAASTPVGGVVAMLLGGLEALYLLTKTRSPNFRKSVRAKKGWGGSVLSVAEREKLATGLSEENAGRYRELRKKYRLVCEKGENELAGNPIIEATIRKMETLSDGYLKSLTAMQRITNLIDSAPDNEFDYSGSDRSDLDRLNSVATSIRTDLNSVEKAFGKVYDRVVTISPKNDMAEDIEVLLANLADAKQTILTNDISMEYSDEQPERIPERSERAR